MNNVINCLASTAIISCVYAFAIIIAFVFLLRQQNVIKKLIIINVINPLSSHNCNHFISVFSIIIAFIFISVELSTVFISAIFLTMLQLIRVYLKQLRHSNNSTSTDFRFYIVEEKAMKPYAPLWNLAHRQLKFGYTFDTGWTIHGKPIDSGYINFGNFCIY